MSDCELIIKETPVLAVDDDQSHWPVPRTNAELEAAIRAVSEREDLYNMYERTLITPPTRKERYIFSCQNEKIREDVVYIHKFITKLHRYNYATYDNLRELSIRRFLDNYANNNMFRSISRNDITCIYRRAFDKHRASCRYNDLIDDLSRTDVASKISVDFAVYTAYFRGISPDILCEVLFEQITNVYSTIDFHKLENVYIICKIANEQPMSKKAAERCYKYLEQIKGYVDVRRFIATNRKASVK